MSSTISPVDERVLDRDFQVKQLRTFLDLNRFSRLTVEAGPNVERPLNVFVTLGNLATLDVNIHVPEEGKAIFNWSPYSNTYFLRSLTGLTDTEFRRVLSYIFYCAPHRRDSRVVSLKEGGYNKLFYPDKDPEFTAEFRTRYYGPVSEDFVGGRTAFALRREFLRDYHLHYTSRFQRIPRNVEESKRAGFITNRFDWARGTLTAYLDDVKIPFMKLSLYLGSLNHNPSVYGNVKVEANFFQTVYRVGMDIQNPRERIYTGIPTRYGLYELTITCPPTLRRLFDGMCLSRLFRLFLGQRTDLFISDHQFHSDVQWIDSAEDLADRLWPAESFSELVVAGDLPEIDLEEAAAEGEEIFAAMQRRAARRAAQAQTQA